MDLTITNNSGMDISEELFRSLLERIHEGKGPQTVELLLTSDEEIRRLNKKYRAKNSSTDVLSFVFDDFGQIAISIPCAEQQASKIGQSFEEELKFLFVHGMLHLAGYDHKTPDEEAAMLKEAYGILGR